VARLRRTLLRLAVGLYLLWLVAVVLLALGQSTAVPLFDPVRWTVVVGAGVLTAVGVAKVLRAGYVRVVG
jgi:hypothetical protein